MLPILLYVFFEIRYFKYKRIINRIPGPPTAPFLGNAHIIGLTPAGMQKMTIGICLRVNDFFLR